MSQQRDGKQPFQHQTSQSTVLLQAASDTASTTSSQNTTTTVYGGSWSSSSLPSYSNRGVAGSMPRPSYPVPQGLITRQAIPQDRQVVFPQQPVFQNLYVRQQRYSDVAEQQQGIQGQGPSRYAPAPPGYTPPTRSTRFDFDGYATGAATATRFGLPEDGVVRECTPPPPAHQEEDLRLLHMRRMVDLANRNTDLAAQMAIIVAEYEANAQEIQRAVSAIKDLI